MTIDEIKAAINAGKTVHWANEGYVVYQDCHGQYLITFTPNGSTVGLTDRASTKLNGRSELFFISRPDLGITIHCETCLSEEVQHECWAAWNAELQTWEVDEFDDKVFCNRCHSETRLISRPIREYGVGQGGKPKRTDQATGTSAHHRTKGESRLSEG